MKNFFRKGTKYKYKLLISYFLIVATPLIIMTGVLYKISADNMQKEIEALNMPYHKYSEIICLQSI